MHIRLKHLMYSSWCTENELMYMVKWHIKEQTDFEVWSHLLFTQRLFCRIVYHEEQAASGQRPGLGQMTFNYVSHRATYESLTVASNTFLSRSP